METIEYRTIDKSAWGAGPWQGEPDKRQWTDQETGLPCLVVRHPDNGHWCGYVGVSEEHPFFRKDYDEVDVSVHGGISFAEVCAPDADESRDICHKPGPGEPDHVWWLGFDCCHYMDLSPARVVRDREKGWGPVGDEVYRDLPYVEAECRRLAKQIAAAAGGDDGQH